MREDGLSSSPQPHEASTPSSLLAFLYTPRQQLVDPYNCSLYVTRQLPFWVLGTKQRDPWLFTRPSKHLFPREAPYWKPKAHTITCQVAALQ